MTDAPREDDPTRTDPASDDPAGTDQPLADTAADAGADAPAGGTTKRRRTVVVVGPDGKPVGTAEVAADGDLDDEPDNTDPASLVEQPAKVMRIGSMIKQLLEEVRAAPLDEAGRQRLREIHARSIVELEEGLAPELRDELERLSLPFDSSTPSEAELRIAQAQLVGWLEGLFHGIQAALVAQQMAARVQLEQMRRGQVALPVGPHGMMPDTMPGHSPQQPEPHSRTGQYL